jgi:hypothetical protein
MRKIVYGLAALATIALAMPSIASAEDMKEGMKGDKMHHPMPMHHHHHHHHHMMNKDTMKK